MAISRANDRTIVPTDAILNREPSAIQLSVMREELVRKILAEEAKKKAREEYRKANILKPGILTMSDEDIDDILKRLQLAKENTPQLSQNKRTKREQKKSEKAFEEKAKQKELEDRMDEADSIMSISTDYIPIIGSLLRGGLYNYARDHLGWNHANNRYGWSPIISGTLDLATIPFGVGAKSLASSYVGGMTGRYVGDKYFDSPHVGLFVGTLMGHPAYVQASKAGNTYRGYLLGRTLNRDIDNAQLINVPVEHVSPNGITKGSALDIGEEGIHLSPAGSPTTYTILQSTGYPFVRTGTWTFSNNTKPVEVLDTGYFGKGFNPEFDTKVSNGVTNFSYTNNFEGKGNMSYLTVEPNWGLLLSKNTATKPSKSISFNIDPSISKLSLVNLIPGQSFLLNKAIPQNINNNQLGQLVSSKFSLMESVPDLALLRSTIMPWHELMRAYFNSGAYARKLSKAGLLNLRDDILKRINHNLDNTDYYTSGRMDADTSAETAERSISGFWTGDKDDAASKISFNRHSDEPTPIYYLILHEANHAKDLNLDLVNLYNQQFSNQIMDNVQLDISLYPKDVQENMREYLDYISTIYPDGTTELSGQLGPAIQYMTKHKMNGKELLSSDYVLQDKALYNMKMFLKEDFLSDVLDKLLSGAVILTTFKNGTRENNKGLEYS